MIDHNVHPESKLLAAFSRGELDFDEIDAIRAHLADCPVCCRALDEVPDDRLLALVRMTVHSEPHVPDRLMPHASKNAAVVVIPKQANDEETPGGGGSEATDLARRGAVANGLPSELVDHPRYRVLDKIGKGGMGDVYRAEHRLMQRTVALKVINSVLVKNPQAVERFRREVRAAASLSHPNIVSAFDAEQAGSLHFLAMEFVEGRNLADVAKANGPLLIRDACRYVRQVAAGLQHAHDRGMIHRDIKPHNLMLADGGTIKILDFGLASLASEITRIDGDQPRDGALTSIGTVIGTPDYISPEQASNARQVDARSDLYSLGATFYFLLAGRPPFTSETVAEKLAQHAADMPEPIQAVREGIPDGLAAVLQRLLAKSPSDRFPSAAELIEALDLLHEDIADSPATETDASEHFEDDAQAPCGRIVEHGPNVRFLSRPAVRWSLAAAVLLAIALTGRFLGDRISSSTTIRPPSPNSTETAKMQRAPKEFAFDFRGGKFDPRLLLPLGIDSRFGASLLKPEEQGLRILIPKGQAASKPSLGFAPALDIAGDFEITATYEILSPPQHDGPSVGPSLYLMAQESLDSAAFRHVTGSEGDAYLIIWKVTGLDGKRSTGRKLFPANTRAGKLRIVRTGGALSFLAQQEHDTEFRVLWRTEFDTRPIGMLRVESWAEGAQDTVDIRWNNLTIRADELHLDPPRVLRDAMPERG
ncbi:MAG: protein kinase [Pirellulaceae bacterium]